MWNTHEFDPENPWSMKNLSIFHFQHILEEFHPIVKRKVYFVIFVENIFCPKCKYLFTITSIIFEFCGST